MTNSEDTSFASKRTSRSRSNLPLFSASYFHNGQLLEPHPNLLSTGNAPKIISLHEKAVLTNARRYSDHQISSLP